MLPINRRQFGCVGLWGLAGGALGLPRSLLAAEAAGDFDPDRPLLVMGRKLRVQPVFMHTTFQRREATSWRSWSAINTPEAAAEERQRIQNELAALAKDCDFPLEILPIQTVTSVDEATKVHAADYDVVVVYPATGSRNMLLACFASKPSQDTLIFARHQSGPLYYWYEALSTSFLKKGEPEDYAACSADNHGPVTVDDVVIDDYAELGWRLRALYAIKNFVGHRILALGGPQGKYDATAPQVAKEKYRFQIADVSYDDLAKRLETLRADAKFTALAEKWTDRYLAIPGTAMETGRPFVADSFALYRIFKDWMREHEATSITINQCMGTIIRMSRTTACLALSWLNDEGYLAFCESDFVVIPPGVLLHYVTGRPVFMHNSTFPHGGIVTCAHCTAPRRLDGKRYEPARIVTHYESDFGAAPKVEIPIGQQVTFLDPEYATGRWLGFTGVIRGNPFHEICRTQQDVAIDGDWKKLIREVRDSHWMMAYGNHLAPARYAARKLGIRWVDVSKTA